MYDYNDNVTLVERIKTILSCIGYVISEMVTTLLDTYTSQPTCKQKLERIGTHEK